MKIKKLNLSSQLLILLLAALVMVFMLQVAQAQSPSNQAQVLQTEMPQRSFGRKILQDTTLNYYTQFLGPTVGGPSGETYNVFQEGFAPYQNFHAANIRYRVNSDWAVGASLAASNSYGDTVTSQQNGLSQNTKVRDEFYNARAFVVIPSAKFDIGTLFTTIAYEAPTSVVAKSTDMQYGGVLTQSFAINLPSLKWTTGVAWQYYRAVYNQNTVSYKKDALFEGSLAFTEARQTTIFNIGPYLGYRFNDRWGVNSSMTFDWDQRGNQTGTSSFNNNLPDRARLGVSYYPSKIKQIANVGLFTQGLVKYTTDTQALGAELAASF